MDGLAHVVLEGLMLAQESRIPLGNRIKKFRGHHRNILADGVFDVVALSLGGREFVDAQLLVEEAVSHFYEVTVEHR